MNWSGRVKSVHLENKKFNYSNIKHIPPKDFKSWHYVRDAFLNLLTNLSHSVPCLIPHKQPNVLHCAWKTNHWFVLRDYDGEYTIDLLNFVVLSTLATREK